MTTLEAICLLVFAHALADFPLQGDYLARAKSRSNSLPGTPWQIALLAHAVIHGGFVGLITGSIALGIAETVAHAVIDHMKCEGHISYVADQTGHIGCKIAWGFLM